MTPRIWYLRVNATQVVDSAFATIPVDLGYLQTVAQDTEVNLLYLTVVQNGEVMSFPSNAYVEVVVNKPDATTWVSTGEILESGQVKINLPYQALAAIGVAHVNVKVFTDTQILTIPPFQIRIILDPNNGTNGDIVSASEYPILTGLINAVQEAGTVSGNMLVWEGYNPSKSYLIGNKVSYNGSSYYCKEPSLNHAPTDTNYWILIASKGDKGDQGIQGEQGIQGIQGLRGIQGIQGANGDKGDTGDTGLQGIQGVQGDSVEYLWNGTQLGIRIEGDAAYTYVDLKGEQGIQGIQGVKGDTGDTGPQGIQGEQGIQGVKGDTGDTGNGIASVVRTSGTGAAGTTDTYTITFTDSTTTTFNVYNGADGEGAGDMLKSQYDTDGDGKVNSADTADSVPWIGVSGKPATFPPETHNHALANLTEKSYNSLTDKPTIPSAYTHPSTHSADIIVDGTTNKAYTATEKTKLTGLANTTINGKTGAIAKADIVALGIPASDTDTIYTHPGSGTNPHGTTKTDVALGSVQNYGIATQAEAQAGTSDVKYMTPLKTLQASPVAQGSYTGDGVATGRTVTVGFTPKFVIIQGMNAPSYSTNSLVFLSGGTTMSYTAFAVSSISDAKGPCGLLSDGFTFGNATTASSAMNELNYAYFWIAFR